jgi:hypothetical protein
MVDFKEDGMATETRRGTDAGVRRRGRALAVGAALVAAVLVWVVARTVFDLDLVVEQPGRPATEVGVDQVVVFSVVPGLVGWGLLAVLERFAAARARAVWTAIASIVLLLSFLPLVQVEATGGTKAALVLMHVVVGVALIAGFWRTGDRPAGGPGRA